MLCTYLLCTTQVYPSSWLAHVRAYASFCLLPRAFSWTGLSFLIICHFLGVLNGCVSGFFPFACNKLKKTRAKKKQFSNGGFDEGQGFLLNNTVCGRAGVENHVGFLEQSLWRTVCGQR